MEISQTAGYQLEINRLLESINSSAERLSGKEKAPLQENGGTVASNLTFGQAYLEPKASFSVQEYISANPLRESAAERYKQSLYNKPDKKEFDTAETAGIDFSEILDRIGTDSKSQAYGKVTQSYAIGQTDSEINTNIMSMNKEFSYATLDYAVSAYSYTQEINRQPHILIDFMHEYNRNYNFEA